jgi:hypothetical protein
LVIFVWHAIPRFLAFAFCGILPVLNAQSPSSIAGQTIQFTNIDGSFPFSSNGVYQLLPSATDDFYAIVPITGQIADRSGTTRQEATLAGRGKEGASSG